MLILAVLIFSVLILAVLALVLVTPVVMPSTLGSLPGGLKFPVSPCGQPRQGTRAANRADPHPEVTWISALKARPDFVKESGHA